MASGDDGGYRFARADVDRKKWDKPPSSLKSKLDILDLDLPVHEGMPLPTLLNLPLEHTHVLMGQLWEDTVYDETYFARSLASKNNVPFVM